MNEIASFISTVGFPIACCIGLFWYMREQSNQHREEMKHLTEALENNTIALTRIQEILRMEGDEFK